MSGMEDLVEIAKGQWIDPSIVGAVNINVADGDATNKKLVVSIRSHTGVELAFFEEVIATASWKTLAYGDSLYADNFIQVLQGRASGEWKRKWRREIRKLLELYHESGIREVQAWAEIYMPMSQVGWTAQQQEAVLWARWLFVAVIVETANGPKDPEFAHQVLRLVTGRMDRNEVMSRFAEHSIQHAQPGICNFEDAQRILQKRVIRGIFLLEAED